MERRDFLKALLGSGIVLAHGESFLEGAVKNTKKWNQELRKKFVENMRISVTSAYWNDSKNIARKFKDRYDTVWVPGIFIYENGSLGESSQTKKSLIDGKPNLYIIQNHPEADTWRPERASALMKLDNARLRDEFARFEQGVNLDLESMTEEDNKNYHRFLERLRKVYNGPLIVSTHAKIRSDKKIHGLGKGMNYKAISEIADVMDYMTLDYDPKNPNEPIGDLEHFKKWLDCLFEDIIDPRKVIASIPTYMKLSYFDKNGNIDEMRKPSNEIEAKIIPDIKELKIEKKEDGEFRAFYKGEKVKGWMMTEDAFKARVELLRRYRINKVAFWYGDKFVERTSKLREIVYEKR